MLVHGLQMCQLGGLIVLPLEISDYASLALSRRGMGKPAKFEQRSVPDCCCRMLLLVLQSTKRLRKPLSEEPAL